MKSESNGEGETTTMGMVANRLEQLYELGMRVVEREKMGKVVGGRKSQQDRGSLAIGDGFRDPKMEHRRATIINKGKPSTKKTNYVYFGH